MQKSSIKYQNKKRKTTPLLKKRNKIYLFTKNLKINKRKNKKLDHVKVESFFIKVVKERINYELNFFVDAKIFLVFHVSILKSIHSKTSIQITFRYQSQKNDEFEIEKILKKKGQKYLVKWKKYFISKNTWEPLKNLKNCAKLLRRYHQRQSSNWSSFAKLKKQKKCQREHSQSSNYREPRVRRIDSTLQRGVQLFALLSHQFVEEFFYFEVNDLWLSLIFFRLIVFFSCTLHEFCSKLFTRSSCTTFQSEHIRSISSAKKISSQYNYDQKEYSDRKTWRPKYRIVQFRKQREDDFVEIETWRWLRINEGDRW